MKDPEKYRTEFLPPAIKAIEDAGGTYVVRGGKTKSFQGAPPESRIVVLKFENMDKAQAWWDSPARNNADAIGEKYATFRIYAVLGRGHNAGQFGKRSRLNPRKILAAVNRGCLSTQAAIGVPT